MSSFPGLILLVLLYCRPSVTASDGLISVEYVVEFAGGQSSVATVNVPENSTALDVMQAATDVDQRFVFTATYLGTKLGYNIDIVADVGVVNNKDYFWGLYYKIGLAPDEYFDSGVDRLKVQPNMTLIVRYIPR